MKLSNYFLPSKHIILLLSIFEPPTFSCFDLFNVETLWKRSPLGGPKGWCCWFGLKAAEGVADMHYIVIPSIMPYDMVLSTCPCHLLCNSQRSLSDES